jgi:diacylglycerol kinase (ATP)
MLYGLLAAAEMWAPTYKNLNQRLRVYCDGRRLRLPQLQGLVVLNINSYHGGMNFWGHRSNDSKATKDTQHTSSLISENMSGLVIDTDEHPTAVFGKQAIDDGQLEIVAIFDIMHCATSRLPAVSGIRQHRLAQVCCTHIHMTHKVQCSRVTIYIDPAADELLEEGVETNTASLPPIMAQVDGEPWSLSPSTNCIRLTYHNRALMLAKRKGAVTSRVPEDSVRETQVRTHACLLE